MASGEQVLGQLKGMVTGLSVKQRIVIAVGALLSVGVIALFVNLMGKPEYKPLYTNMEPADAQALVARLAEKNIPAETSPDGKSVSVPADKLDAARLQIASQGMPRSGRLGFELFDKMNWGQTEFDEKVNYQRALEGELERTIKTLNGVDSVRVHLVMPSDSVFVDREREAKASVTLNLRTGSITPDMQASIARLVSGAVDKLNPENVTIVDANNNLPANLPKHDPLSPEGNLEKEMTARLMGTLEPVVGADRVRASVNIDYDSSSSEENQETYDPKSAVAVSTQKTEEQSGSGTNGGVPGTSSNVPGASGNPKEAADEEQDTQTSKSDSSTYVVSKVTKHILEPAGRIHRISAALVVDDAIDIKQENGKHTEVRRKRTPEELKQIEDLAKAAIGFDSARGDALSVQNISFRQTVEAELLPKNSVSAKVRTFLMDWSSVLRQAGLVVLFLIVYLLILRPVKKQVVTAFRELPSQVSASQASLQSSASGELDGQHTLVLKKQLVDKVKAEPASASRLVQAWLREGGQ
jgi:flagellar M-ring protein FliF